MNKDGMVSKDELSKMMLAFRLAGEKHVKDKVNGIFATIGALSVFDSESHFVKKLKFQKGIVGNAAFWKTEQGGKEAKRCALVLEKGDCDLKVSAGAPMSMSTSACCACASFRRACEQAKEIGDRWIDG